MHKVTSNHWKDPLDQRSGKGGLGLGEEGGVWVRRVGAYLASYGNHFWCCLRKCYVMNAVFDQIVFYYHLC